MVFENIFDLIDINARIRCRKDMISFGLKNKDVLDLLHFRSEVVEALCHQDKDINVKKKPGRPSLLSGVFIKHYEKKNGEDQP